MRGKREPIFLGGAIVRSALERVSPADFRDVSSVPIPRKILIYAFQSPKIAVFESQITSLFERLKCEYVFKVVNTFSAST